MKKRKQFFVLMIIIIVMLINIGCDQVSKRYADKNLKGKGVVQVVGNFVILRYIKNHGGFLGMGSELPKFIKAIIFTILPLFLMCCIIFYIIISKNLTIFEVICLATILGGGFSNIFDRVVHNGEVTDFLNFGIGTLRTGILNFADMSITFGAVFLLLANFYKYQKSKQIDSAESID